MTTWDGGDEYATIQQDAQPSQSEQCADWLDIPPDAVGEDDLMRWLDWLRDCEEARGWQ